jgi:Fis family transcriptional regulator, factor for inversion stimulation protein
MTITKKREKKQQTGEAAAKSTGPSRTNGAAALGAERQPLHQCVTAALSHYFKALDGETPVGLYEFVMCEVERPLLEFVLHELGGNQSRAADILGLNRGTLRKKLMHYGLLDS